MPFNHLLIGLLIAASVALDGAMACCVVPDPTSFPLLALILIQTSLVAVWTGISRALPAVRTLAATAGCCSVAALLVASGLARGWQEALAPTVLQYSVAYSAAACLRILRVGMPAADTPTKPLSVSALLALITLWSVAAAFNQPLPLFDLRLFASSTCAAIATLLMVLADRQTNSAMLTWFPPLVMGALTMALLPIWHQSDFLEPFLERYLLCQVTYTAATAWVLRSCGIRLRWSKVGSNPAQGTLQAGHLSLVHGR